MQRDHHVQFTRCDAAHITAFEHQPRMLQRCRRGVAQGDHVFTQLDPGHLAFGVQGIAQIVVDRERQIPLARTEIRDAYRLVQRQG
ncbi:hypothetical protein D3C87_2047690 [compost metagenome]